MFSNMKSTIVLPYHFSILKSHMIWRLGMHKCLSLKKLRTILVWLVSVFNSKGESWCHQQMHINTRKRQSSTPQWLDVDLRLVFGGARVVRAQTMCWNGKQIWKEGKHNWKRKRKVLWKWCDHDDTLKTREDCVVISVSLSRQTKTKRVPFGRVLSV